MSFDLRVHARVVRPSWNLAAAEAFWVAGVGFEVLWRQDSTPADPGRRVMVGFAGGGWHVELVHDPFAAGPDAPNPAEQLVVYLGPLLDDECIRRIERYGGVRLPPTGPDAEPDSVAFLDPDGYRVQLQRRYWP
ncbi:MAG TPA: VOC family protein [Mycobacteriales bacterium]|nr:VOC family protein [Mycobacteriales bacterium]